jgi:hypothetical protein
VSTNGGRIPAKRVAEAASASTENERLAAKTVVEVVSVVMEDRRPYVKNVVVVGSVVTTYCIECGGSGICDHGKRKADCKVCKCE